jgi:hypothetical protein
VHVTTLVDGEDVSPMEALEVEPSQRITWDSDTVNPDPLRLE